MNIRIAVAGFAVLGVAALLPATVMAANVGIYGSCLGGSKNAAITTAGHTPVAVATLDNGSLNGLGALIVENCNGAALTGRINAAVISAVNGGMLLVVNDWNPNGSTAAALPGTPALTWQGALGTDINLVAAMPYITGAGGTLTATSLDGGSYSNHGYTASPMPVGVSPLLTTADGGLTVAVRYSYGAGSVVYSAIPMDAYLPGAAGAGYPNAAGLQTYLSNILSNSSLVSTTCASEGYTGTKLTWCKNICEKGYTGATLDMWIHRWINKYRDLPYCAQEGGGAEEPPPQEF